MNTKNGGQAIHKRWLHLVTVLIITLLGISTLLSNTLYGLTLPKVAVQIVGAGQLVQTFKGSAFLKAIEVREVSGQPGWNVTKVLVQEGDIVKKGQVLVQYNNDEALNLLQTEKNTLNKLLLSMEKLEYDYVQAEHNEDKGNILAAKAAVDSLKLDISQQQKRIQDLNAKWIANQSLFAPCDGKVAGINAKEGMPANAGAPDVRILNTQQGYKIDLLIPTSMAESLLLGETIETQLSGPNNRAVSGKITSLVGAGMGNGSTSGTSGGQDDKQSDMTQMTLSFQDASLVGNERVEVAITKKGPSGGMLVSKTAVRSDPTGSFVYAIEERKGPLGNAFHAVRRKVTVLESNEQAAAVEGLFAQESVIVESSEPLLDGSRVRIVE
ncbi:efflux RND transporter periplasmic adaptor subunit [Paenibacillus planticolens]|nr:biotin/lipoyl-binding protein [Paenibacillus planticolens]